MKGKFWKLNTYNIFSKLKNKIETDFSGRWNTKTINSTHVDDVFDWFYLQLSPVQRIERFPVYLHVWVFLGPHDDVRFEPKHPVILSRDFKPQINTPANMVRFIVKTKNKIFIVKFEFSKISKLNWKAKFRTNFQKSSLPSMRYEVVEQQKTPIRYFTHNCIFCGTT